MCGIAKIPFFGFLIFIKISKSYFSTLNSRSVGI